MRKKIDKKPFFVRGSPTSFEGEPDYIKKVDKFAERFYNGDYKINSEAYDIPCSLDGVESTLGHFLTWSLNEYMIAKSDKNNINKFQRASECLSWITHAFGVGVIEETESLSAKLELLREEYDKLYDKYLQLKKENDELHMVLDRFSSVGEVEN